MRIALCFLLALSIFSCATDDFQQESLNNSISFWADKDVDDYSYTFRKVCFCPAEDDIAVIVMGGNVVEASYISSGTPLTGADLSNVLTLADMFGVVQDAIDANTDRIVVDYNMDYGYPEYIFLDVTLGIADDETEYFALDFMEL